MSGQRGPDSFPVVGRNIIGGVFTVAQKFPCKCFVIDTLHRRRSRDTLPLLPFPRAHTHAHTLAHTFSSLFPWVLWVVYPRGITGMLRPAASRRAVRRARCKFPNQQFKAAYSFNYGFRAVSSYWKSQFIFLPINLNEHVLNGDFSREFFFISIIF